MFFALAYGAKFTLYHRKCGISMLSTSKSKTVFLICSLLYPYLVVKKEQAAGVIEFLNLRRKEGRMGRKYIERETEIMLTVKALNGGRFL